MKKIIIFTDDDDYNGYNHNDAIRSLQSYLDISMCNSNKEYIITVEEVEICK